MKERVEEMKTHTQVFSLIRVKVVVIRSQPSGLSLELTANDLPLFDSTIFVCSCKGSLERMMKRRLDCLY